MSGRFWISGLIGAVMVGISIALVAYFAHGLGMIGSCSSTGRINGRAVPTCSASDVLNIVGIFPAVGLGLLGLVVSGRRAPRHKRTGTFGVAAWSVGYLVVGTALIATAFNPASEAGGFDRVGWAIPGFIFIPLGLGGLLSMPFRNRKKQVAQRLMLHGDHAMGEILAVRDTGVTINNNPRVHLQIEVRPSTGEPFRAEKTITVSRLAIPRPGDQVQVWWDREDRSKFAIGLRAEQPNAPVVTAAAVDVPTGAPTALTDTLERLARLRAQGALSDQEFETAKMRALAS